jgi:phage/plasmid-associated DNA primase
MPNDFFVVHKGGFANTAEAPSSFLHSCLCARAVLVPEAPEGQLNMPMLKGLCEQQSIPVAARKMRSDPENRQPNFEIFFTSNHSIDLGDTVDSGDARRVNVLRLTSRFAGDDEQREDVSLKQRISRGELGMEFFYIVKEFAVTLQLWNTDILQPPRVVRETAEALKSDKLAAFIEWM